MHSELQQQILVSQSVVNCEFALLKWVFVVIMQEYTDRTVSAKTWLANKLHNKNIGTLTSAQWSNLGQLKSFLGDQGPVQVDAATLASHKVSKSPSIEHCLHFCSHAFIFLSDHLLSVWSLIRCITIPLFQCILDLSIGSYHFVVPFFFCCKVPLNELSMNFLQHLSVPLLSPLSCLTACSSRLQLQLCYEILGS